MVKYIYYRLTSDLSVSQSGVLENNQVSESMVSNTDVFVLKWFTSLFYSLKVLNT